MLTHTGKRLTTRIADHVQDKLQLEKADKVIESESTIVLTRRESLRLLELIENPPPMNAKLEKLMADYEKGRADDRDSSNKSTHTPAHL